MFYNKLKFLVLYVFLSTSAMGQELPSPKTFFGSDIGTDYTLVNFTQAEAYFKTLALSERVEWVDIGLTEEGRHQPMMIITSPENHKNLDRFKELSQKLARAEISMEQAKIMISEAKPIIWIDGGLHANETVGTHQLIETYYQLVTRNDEETLKILDDVIILLAHANPDGHEMISNWYMRPNDLKKRDMSIPALYQKYAGHDNNRDFFMNNLKESTNISRQQYIEWMPQIIYNHHQTSPAGTVVAGPPYRDPFNHALDPMLITGIDGVGAAMINGLYAEGKPGYTRLGGSPYSTWWNGGLRTTPYFHNMIGILTEITGNPTPSAIPFVPSRLLANNNTPFPVQPQPWSFRQSIDYSVSLNYAVLNYARSNAHNLLFNIYKMGRNAIEKGNQDTWSPLPNYVERIEKQYAADRKEGKVNQDDDLPYNRRGGVPNSYYEAVFKDKDLRDPRGFIIPADQSDFPTAVDFVNALIKSGIQIHQATSDFTVGGKNYPIGSYIIKTAQAFKPHILDMFEPQDHPNDFQYPGGPPIRPYDAAGWTLAFQMGIVFDRILDGFEGPFQELPYGAVQKPHTPQVNESQGFLLDGGANNAFMVVNRLLKNGAQVYRVDQMIDGAAIGSFYVSGDYKDILEDAAKESGIKLIPVNTGIPMTATEVKSSRIALYDYYGGSMPSGWVRWIMEKYQFDYEVIFPQDIDRGNLNSKYDVILFISGGIPRTLSSSDDSGGRQPEAENIPKEFHSMLGNISSDKSLPELVKFLENGGNIVTVGSSTHLAYHLDLPIKNALTEIDKDGKEKQLPGEKYYIPGSILIARINHEHPSNYGMEQYADVMFNNSNVFKLKPEAGNAGIEPLAWFDRPDPLRSGWAYGQSYLEDGVLAFQVPVGKGTFIAYGPEITFRAQSFGTFKMLFNHLLKASDKMNIETVHRSE
ncbi:peptidase [Anditalea andensis]|uniref:Peptidase n=2 Tax=Anditalea andensis TaxID=1048983 RepID=A0A074KYX4_9BACT|nr:peptidase [Anditalea andensis]